MLSRHVDVDDEDGSCNDLGEAGSTNGGWTIKVKIADPPALTTSPVLQCKIIPPPHEVTVLRVIGIYLFIYKL